MPKNMCFYNCDRAGTDLLNMDSKHNKTDKKRAREWNECLKVKEKLKYSKEVLKV